MSALHDGAATPLLLRSVGILALVNLGNEVVSLDGRARCGKRPVAYLSPYGWNHKVASVVAVADETVEVLVVCFLNIERIKRTKELPRRP